MKKLTVLTALLLPTSLQGYPRESLPVKSANLLLTKNTSIRITDNTPNTMSQSSVAKLIARAGFPKEIVPVMTCLAERESNFKADAINENTNHSRDYGLLQINSLWLKKEGCNLSAEDLLNPEKNIACAYKVYKTQGLSAWTTYNKFKDACLAYEVDGMDHNTLLAEAKILENEEELM